MKNKLHKLLAMAAMAVTISFSAKAQTISDFENLTLPKADTFWNGQSTPNGATFTSGNVVFNNYYNQAFGGYWESGFAYTNKRDSANGTYTNLYGSKAFTGFGGSTNYVTVTESKKLPIIKLTGSAAGKIVSGFYCSNSSYAYNTILKGNFGARKFGDTTGTHSGMPQGSQPDWFKITINKWLGGIKSTDSIDFYLADYRFSNNAQDYIIKDWTWVDLTSLGNVDSLSFHLSSTDNSVMFGMNTPAFFCMDNFTTKDVATGINEIVENKISVYPNPATTELRIMNYELGLNAVEIINALGQVCISIVNPKSSIVNIENLNSGIYFFKTIDNSGFERTTKFVKD